MEILNMMACQNLIELLAVFCMTVCTAVGIAVIVAVGVVAYKKWKKERGASAPPSL